MHQRGLNHTTEGLSNALPGLKNATELPANDWRLRAIFEQVAVGMACVDRDSQLQKVNQRFCALLGYTSEELLQCTLQHITHPDDLAAILPYLHSSMTLETTQSFTQEMRYIHKDKSFVWVHLTISPVYLKEGLLDCFVCAVEDISQRKQQEEQFLLPNLQETNTRLEWINKVQNDFIAIVSHEFRTTLTGIQGFSELLRDADFNVAEVKEYANDINTNAMRLNRMFSELFDLERLKSGKMLLRVGKVDINTILQEVAERMLLVAPRHMVLLNLDEPLPLIEADYDRLMQVVTNLTSNATKYSPGGGTILLKSFADGATVHICVQDHGIGIPADALEKIFTPYSHIAEGKTRYIQKTGLGLAMVYQIVQMHRGRVWAESELGHGSTFHVTLPIT